MARRPVPLTHEIVPRTIDDLVDWPDRDVVVLVEMEPSKILTGFVAVSGMPQTYQVAFPRQIGTDDVAGGLYAPCTRVRENSTDLAQRASSAEVAATAGSWYWDEAAELLYVHMSGGGLPASYTLVQAFVLLRFATKGVTLTQALTSSADYAAAVVREGASHHWRLNETSGTAVADAIGGVTGVADVGVHVGQPGGLADPENRAMAFDGTGRIRFPRGPFMEWGTGPLTIEWWMRTPALPASPPYAWIFDTSNNGTVQSGIEAVLEATGHLSITAKTPVTATRAFADAPLGALGAWHHCAVVIERGTSQRLLLYVDGVASAPHDVTGMDFTPSVDVADLAWAGINQAEATFNFTGGLDELAVYPVALTPAQIAEHHRLGTARAAAHYHGWVTPDTEASISTVGDGLFAIRSSPSSILVLTNTNQIFQRLTATNGPWFWKNRRVNLFVGGTVRNHVFARDEYQPFLAMLISDTTCNDQKAEFSLKPRTFKLDMGLPKTPIFETEYPNLDPNVRGTFKFLIWGKGIVAPPCVDILTSQGVYLVADARYQTLTTVHRVWARASQTGALTLLAGGDYSVNLTACTVTVLNASYPAATFDLVVEVTGKNLVTAAEIVKDILKTFLEASDDDLDLPSFVDAAAQAPEPLAVILTSQRTIASILQTAEPSLPSIERSVLAVLRETQDGKWQFKVRSLLSGFDAQLTQRDFAAFEPSPTNETSFGRSTVFYGWNHATDGWAVASFEDNRTLMLLATDDVQKDPDEALLYTYLALAGDATTLAQRYQAMAGGPRILINFEERSARLYQALVGDRVAISYTPAPSVTGSFEGEVFELAELRKSIAPTLQTAGVFRDIRGLTAGAWVWAADDVPPDWASTPPADRTLEGFWADDNGFIDPADATTQNIRKWA